jgi:Lon protease-like protein
MPADVQHDFPLFELGLVALPGEIVPLHIFEERYRAMFAHCVDTESEFAILFSGPDGVAAVGCACAVTEVLERLEDGRMNVITRGTRPVRLLDRRQDLPYPAGSVEVLRDDEEEPDAEAAREARDAYAELVEQATEKTPEAAEIAEMSAYAMAATVDFGMDAKQALLDLRSETARLRLVTRLFRAAVKRLDYVERAQARAASNGKVRFG